MKFKTILSTIFIVSIIFGNSGCKEKNENKAKLADGEKIETVDNEKIEIISVFNYDNPKELSEYNALNLDATHPNLLNPQISSSDYDSVIKSWTELHQRIGAYLSENGFNWEVEDKTISIVHKIYFKSNGEIENYFFKVLNENVTKEKKKQFANLISEFPKDIRIEFENDGSFAQCGKTKYIND
ncbi:hypothetical protein LX77_01457 [Gelidibacter algens]|uniref:Uncharacterized protein n=1 Tax=Gelidibacter algens TaxID=49280 RepID=A0A1A7R1L0_9FLAO|nr:hypothetical protein [Gelidibacter algens]OBX25369.1 hypothetical protein A9996_10525 [Gelidibacter algens]RAJ25156.1 hypothetical protein LX77_01457 [Gelidibacter algens]